MRYLHGKENPVRDDFFRSQGIEPSRVLAVELIHSRTVLYPKGPEELLHRRADGLIVEPGPWVPTVTVADCMPIWIRHAATGSYGILHSGWRGTGILEAAVWGLAERYGAEPSEIDVLFGPAIGPCCYRVPEERARLFQAEFGPTRSVWSGESLEAGPGGGQPGHRPEARPSLRDPPGRLHVLRHGPRVIPPGGSRAVHPHGGGRRLRPAGTRSRVKLPGGLRLWAALACLAFARFASAQPVLLAYEGSDSYVITEKSDWSRYEDGRYVGHVYREVRGRLEPDSPSPGALWRGDFLVFEETLRDMAASARRVDEQVPASFRIAPDGSVRMAEDKGYPSIRGFPAFPPGPVSPGDRWIAEGVRVVDPADSGVMTRTRILAEYEYRGEETYRGIPVRRIFAKYAVRYRAGQDPKGDPGLLEAQGTHEADILVRSDTGRPVVIRDRLDETFRFSSGPSLRYRGFTLTFYDAAVPRTADPASGALRAALAGPGASAPPAAAPGTGAPSGTGAAAPSGTAAAPSGTGSAAPPGLLSAGTAGVLSQDSPQLDPASGVVLEDRPEGPTLVAFGLRFVPDQDILLPEEKGRLDGIAAALRSVPGERTFLVTGHTADVGNPAGQKDLSVRRAKRVVDELVARGIPASRFLFRGFGAERPLAPNDTEANRARNRRVEITVLN